MMQGTADATPGIAIIFTTSIKIDGRTEEKAWEEAEVIRNFTMLWQKGNPPVHA